VHHPASSIAIKPIYTREDRDRDLDGLFHALGGFAALARRHDCVVKL
jgi:hypothetical protein